MNIYLVTFGHDDVFRHFVVCGSNQGHARDRVANTLASCWKYSKHSFIASTNNASNDFLLEVK